MNLEERGTATDIEQLLAVRDEIDSLIQQSSGTGSHQPRADLVDHGDSYQLHLEVPGVDQADLEIAVEETEVLVAGLREPPLTDSRILFSERSVGPFQRTIALPGPVDREGATAHLASGVLVVTLPKRAI